MKTSPNFSQTFRNFIHSDQKFLFVTGSILLLLSFVIGENLFTMADDASPDPSTIRGIENKVEYIKKLTLSGDNTQIVLSGYKTANGNVYLGINKGLTVGAKAPANVGENANSLVGFSGTVPGTNMVVIGTQQATAQGQYGVQIGGVHNTISNNGSVSLGGNNNTVNGGFALLGSGNTVTKGISFGGENTKNQGENTITFGSRIKSTIKNAFIFSDGHQDFTPMKDNTFYLNAQKGVGINAHGGITGITLDVGGAIRLGTTANVEDVPCSADAKGFIVYSSGCICGCNGEIYEPFSTQKGCGMVCNGSEDGYHVNFDPNYDANGGGA